MYIIKRTKNKIDSINDNAWKSAEIANINICNWDEYKRNIKTTAKLLYSDLGVHVQMQTDERPLLARFTEQNGPVCKDSCMEFFISPNENDIRYINFEFNPFGTIHYSIIASADEWTYPDKKKDYFEVQSYVDEEKWIIQFFIPFEFTDGIFGYHTKKMRGNIYKCGADTAKKHYISYYPIYTEEPNFHSPQFFGDFVLE